MKRSSSFPFIDRVHMHNLIYMADSSTHTYKNIKQNTRKELGLNKVEQNSSQ